MLAEKYQQVMPSGSKENTRISPKWLRHWLFVEAKCAMILACSLGLSNLEKAGFPHYGCQLLSHKRKYLLSMTVEDAYKILQDENPAFPYNIQEIPSAKCEDPKVQWLYSLRLSQAHKR